MSASLDYIVQDSVDYDLYNSSSWNDIDGFLEQSILNEKQRLEQQLEQIYRQLDEREQIHEDRVESIEDEILRQKDRLDSAERKPGNDDVNVRHRLESLYQEKWEAKQSVWNDKQNLLEENRDLKRELRELEKSRDLNKML
jgi:hypothetical protein